MHARLYRLTALLLPMATAALILLDVALLLGVRP
jgi:hypothetical protein